MENVNSDGVLPSEDDVLQIEDLCLIDVEEATSDELSTSGAASTTLGTSTIAGFSLAAATSFSSDLFALLYGMDATEDGRAVEILGDEDDAGKNESNFILRSVIA